MRVVILGSGATYGTIRECPTLEGFGRALVARRPAWRDAYPGLAGVVADLSSKQHPEHDRWNLRDVWVRVDYYAKLHPALGAANYGAQVSAGLHRAVRDV